jgi:serine/threonine protein kinase
MHSHRLLHRDVTPRNVRLTADGRAKLIDFGTLCTFGTATQIVGTAPCMAPEVMRGLALDQRTDLYSLGAIAYWALTGRHAYPARRTQELWTLWQTPPRPPSQLADGVPPELDALVLSLLSVDPLARPANAAQVIDALTAIGGLAPEEHEQAADSYLSSGPLVGRSQEQSWLQQRMARAFSAHGTAIVIEGPSGIGKTRLLQDLCLQAQLRGAVVLRADAQASSRAFGVATALASQLVAEPRR